MCEEEKKNQEQNEKIERERKDREYKWKRENGRKERTKKEKREEERGGGEVSSKWQEKWEKKSAIKTDLQIMDIMF